MIGEKRHEDIDFHEIAKKVVEGEYDDVLRKYFVKKGKGDEVLSGYLSGVRKSIALLLYAAEKDDWIKLTEATHSLYISRSSAHKLIRRKLDRKDVKLVEVTKEGKWMQYRLTPEGKRAVEKIVNILKKR